MLYYFRSPKRQELRRHDNVWGPEYIDQLVLRNRDTDFNGTLDERLYAIQDANWNVTALVNPAGSTVERYLYEPYGEATYLTGSFVSRSVSNIEIDCTFTGRRQDFETKFHQYRHRDYGPHLGLFLARDPRNYVDGLSFYPYVGSAPLQLVDPYGLVAVDSNEIRNLCSKYIDLKKEREARPFPPMPFVGCYEKIDSLKTHPRVK